MKAHNRTQTEQKANNHIPHACKSHWTLMDATFWTSGCVSRAEARVTFVKAIPEPIYDFARTLLLSHPSCHQKTRTVVIISLFTHVDSRRSHPLEKARLSYLCWLERLELGPNQHKRWNTFIQLGPPASAPQQHYRTHTRPHLATVFVCIGPARQPASQPSST